MKYYKYILILLMTMGLSVSTAQETINIKLSDIDENGNVTLNLKLNIEQAPVVVEPVEPEPEEPPVIPEEPVEPSGLRPQVIYDEDLAVDLPASTAINPAYPRGLSEIFDITYNCSYRAYANGESNSHHVTGILALNKANNSIYMAGRAEHDAIAEFAVPSDCVVQEDFRDTPGAKPIQQYVKLLDKSSNDVITGMSVINGKLWVNSEIEYDAGGKNQRALQILDADNLQGSDKSLFNRVNGDAKIAGWISEIPEDARALFDGKRYFMGNAANYSINVRYSMGPSFAVFNPEDLQGNILATRQKMAYPYINDGSTHITPKADDIRDDNPSALWNVISKSRYAFIPKNSKILVVIGTNNGYDGTPIIYKTDTRYPDLKCDGSCPVSNTASTNFYWLFDLNAIAQATKPHLIQPFNYGRWLHPLDNNKGNIGGAAFDIDTGQLHISLKGAAKQNDFDNPPLINIYTIKFKEVN